MAHLTPSALATQIGFDLPERYNMSRLLWDNLETSADAPAILSDAGTFTYADLAAEAGRIGNHLLALGCAPGDRILCLMDDEPAYPAAIMGAARAGLVPMLINTLSTDDLLRFFLDDSGATAAIASRPLVDRLGAEVLKGTGCRTVLDVGARPWADAPTFLAEHPTTRGDMAFWMYSSGSTGRPKGVVHKHEDPAYTAATYSARTLALGPADICFSVPKIYFAYGFGNSVTFPMATGGAALLMAGRPEPERIFDQIARHRPTVLFGLPTLYTALARSDAAATADLASVRLCLSAAEVLSQDIAESWKARFGHDIVEGLGSTEMLHIYLSNEPHRRKAGSAGRAVPGYAVRLVTPDGSAEAAEGEEGVMEVAGLSRADSYWNRPDKTAETMRGDWLWTGDRFVRDSEGFYFFRGRIDDLVKVSGQWVYPLEIELALNEHPEVHESCVLAVPMSDGRTTIRAFVVPRSGPADGLAARLKDHSKTALLPHKYPREIVFLDALPKTGTDKIDRQALLRRDAPQLSEIAP